MKNVCISVQFDSSQCKLILQEVIRALTFSQIYRFSYLNLNNVSPFISTKNASIYDDSYYDSADN